MRGLVMVGLAVGVLGGVQEVNCGWWGRCGVGSGATFGLPGGLWWALLVDGVIITDDLIVIVVHGARVGSVGVR